MFNLKWWKKEKPLDEEVIKKAIKEALEEETKRKGQEFVSRWNEHNQMPLTFVVEKPYKNLWYINGNLTVTFNDGDNIGNNVDEETFQKVREAGSKEDIILLLTSKQRKEEMKEETRISDNIQILLESGEFELKGDSIYMKGISRSVPELLLNAFASSLEDNCVESTLSTIDCDDDYIALKRFWMWCCLNPRAEVADKLYDFLQKNGMKINKQGMFIALRNVVTTENCDGKLVDFISNVYHKIKAIWKRPARNYEIIEIEE